MSQKSLCLTHFAQPDSTKFSAEYSSTLLLTKCGSNIRHHDGTTLLLEMLQNLVEDVGQVLDRPAVKDPAGHTAVLVQHQAHLHTSYPILRPDDKTARNLTKIIKRI